MNVYLNMVLFTEIGKRQYELYPFLFMKGFAETDDVMHNAMGCVIGWLMVKG